MRTQNSERIREYALRQYIEPARHRGESLARVVAGEVHSALGLHNLVPQVCNALASQKFLKANRLVLEKREGPPSGMGTTVVFTYRLEPAVAADSNPLDALWGIGKEVFESLGGGEAFIRRERESFYTSKEDS